MEVDKKLIKVSADHYGLIDTSANAMEECSELVQCIAKELRGSKDPSHMEEEIGDVLISLHNLIYIYGLDEEKIQTWIKFKQNRQMARMKLERIDICDSNGMRQVRKGS